MSRRFRNNDPYFLTARFESVCPETGKPIKRGDECAYYPAERKAYHTESKAAAHVREMQFNRTFNMADADW